MNTEKILICENESLVAEDIKSQVTDLGYLVSGIAKNEDEAIALVKKDKPDLALMDISLDGATSGNELAYLLRRDFGIPSIYLTAQKPETFMFSNDKAEPLGYLEKPGRKGELALSVRYGLAQNKARKLLEKQLTDVSYQAGVSQKILTSLRAGLASEARMEGLGNIIGGVADHYGNSLLALSLPLEMLLDGGTLKSFESRLLRGVVSRLAAERTFLTHLRWAAGQSGLTVAVNSSTDFMNAIVSSFALSLAPEVTFGSSSTISGSSFFFDREALTFAITSLLDNAKEAVGLSGLIHLSAEQVEVNDAATANSAATNGEYLKITITDSGVGIKPEDLPHIAEPFFTTHAERVATGLGLTAAYGIARAHGGWVSITSRLEAGTVASIFIPWAGIIVDEESSKQPSKQAVTPTISDGFIFSTRFSGDRNTKRPMNLQTGEVDDARLFGYL